MSLEINHILFHAGTFFLFALVCAVAILFIVKIVPETKGKTLEEIQASMNSST